MEREHLPKNDETTSQEFSYNPYKLLADDNEFNETNELSNETNELANETSGSQPKLDAISEIRADENEANEKKESGKKDSVFFYAILLIILALIAIILLPRIIPQRTPPTLDELHLKNLQAKLSPDKGYVYNGLYSFVYYDGLWHTQLKVPGGDKLFNIHFHYGPRDVEHIAPVGLLNLSYLDRYKNFYMTFDPNDEDLSYIAVAISETNFPLVNMFNKRVIASCINNESEACSNRPIIDCNSTSAPVFYFASENETNIIYLNNCIIVTGKKEELFRATDRMLFDLMQIIQRMT